MEAGVCVMIGEVPVDGDDATLNVGKLGVMGDNADAGSRSVTIGNRGDALAHIMLLGGVPADGPLVFHRPFVMNPVEQIRYAEKA